MHGNPVYQLLESPENHLTPLMPHTASTLRRVTSAHIREVERDLSAALDSGADVIQLHNLQVLAALNFLLACEKGYAKTRLQACALTLIRLCARSLIQREDVLDHLRAALATVDPQALGLDGYRACMNATEACLPCDGGAPLSNAARAKDALQYAQLALECAQRVSGPGDHESSGAGVGAMLMQAQLLARLGQDGPSDQMFERALAASTSVPDRSIDLQVTVYSAWGQTHALRAQHKAAIKCWERAVALREQAAEWSDGRIAEVVELHLLMGHHAALDRQRNKGATHYKRAYALLVKRRDSGQPADDSLVRRVVAHIASAQGAKTGQAFRELQKGALSAKGVIDAARYGHAGSVTVVRIDPARMRTPPGERVGSTETMKGLRPGDRRLLHILNADRPAVRRMIQDLMDELGGQSQPGEWSISNVFGPQACQSLIDYYRCVLLLQRMADHICHVAAGQPPQNRAHFGDTIRFPDFSVEEIELLGRVIDSAGRTDRYAIQAGPPGCDDSYFNHQWPEDDYYVRLGPAETVALCVRTVASAGDSSGDTTRWIGEAFSRLMREARRRESRLRQCHMPPPPGRTPVEVQCQLICGTFYMPPGDKENCWNASCEEAHRRHDSSQDI